MTEDTGSFLESFIANLRKFENLERKTLVFPIMKEVREKSFHSNKEYKSMGEDAAAILFDDESKNLLLLTTDEITEEFSKKSPWAAGFSSIMVGADDIYACGGTPTAASVIISTKNSEIRKQLLQGVLEATHRFEIPLVRGHTADKTSNIAVSATVVGKIRKEYYISAGGAQEGDLIVLISDFDGRVGETSKYYWNTVTFKNKNEILMKRAIMLRLAEKKILTASKDVSNGGIFGTLLLLLQYSKKGALIDLDLIKAPKGIITPEFPLVDYVKMYLTSAFLVTVAKSNYITVKKMGENHALEVFKIGEIDSSSKFKLKYKNLTREFLDITQYY